MDRTSSNGVRDEVLRPPREAALQLSDEVQTMNRQAYIGQQSDVADIYRAAERKSRWQLGTALALSLAVLLATCSVSDTFGR